MMNHQIRRALVTGVAGFIGSHLAERLLDGGAEVIGLDCFTPYYPLQAKRANLERLLQCDRFAFSRVDLSSQFLEPYLEDVEAVFHQAGQPGVRSSWQTGFEVSVRHNVVATQRLLEAARGTGVQRFVYASSSSVYGNTSEPLMHESDNVRPFSPYGVTKLSAEQLCTVYAENYGVPTIALRYFTVYGPRQRPDMAINRLIHAALTRDQFPLFGTGDQVRDFTFVEDVVAANIAAATKGVPAGSVVNIAGGSTISMRNVISTVEEVLGMPVPVQQFSDQPGDVLRTQADLERARTWLDWKPTVVLTEGLRRQAEWQSQALAAAPAG